MGDLLEHVSISPAAGGIGAFFTALFLVLGFMLKRLQTGDDEIRAGYKGLVGDIQASSGAYQERALKAEREKALEHGWRVRAEEYAHGLETQLGIPHRVWTYEERDTS